ncbi:MAG TPA: trypsin-like peptidase domain-containing protein [Virgibacillus sp.]|nr:trypsin-like peptidase domain-containing protein [Virgibacillus sp.]
MDNYNDQYPPNAEEEKNKPKKSRRWFIPILLGIIIGVLATTIVLPAVMNQGKDTAQPKDDDEAIITEKEEDGSAKNSYVSVDVTTQITEIVDEVLPAVVGVTNIQRQADFWRQQEGNEAGTGSGVIYKQDKDHAYVVTNHHVIEGADTIEVVLSDETTVEAELLGSDLFTDLAVLRMDNSDVKQTIEIGSSDNVKVGEPAIAIGNPLGHMFSGTVTQGIISGTQRTIPLDFNQDGRADWQAEVIQTDAAINPGNSGGALINIKGQLIGINSMKINQASVEGIGFAIPIDTALPVIEELEETGEVTRPYLGVEIYSLEEVPKAEWNRTLNLPEDIEGGVYVWSVEPLSPADQSGLKRLDVITKLDDTEILSTIDLRKILYDEKEIGDDVHVTYYRDGKKHETTITLGVQK